MAPIREQLNEMIDSLPDNEQMLIFEIVKRFMSDAIATYDDLDDIEEARAEYDRGETISHDSIDWG